MTTKQLQLLLIKWGVVDDSGHLIKADGIMGAKTVQAVKRLKIMIKFIMR